MCGVIDWGIGVVVVDFVGEIVIWLCVFYIVMDVVFVLGYVGFV